jgi:hypothetical protein
MRVSEKIPACGYWKLYDGAGPKNGDGGTHQTEEPVGFILGVAEEGKVAHTALLKRLNTGYF